MSIIQAIVLGIVQGLTEFIPISSSGHLVLIPWLLNWPAPSLAFDVALHWGTVLAVLVFFWRDWLALFWAGLAALRDRSLADPQARLLIWLAIATIPAALAGFFLEDFFARAFVTPAAAAAFLIVTALLLVSGEVLARSDGEIESLRLANSLLIGIAQAIAILPGISRSGATIAAGRWQGLDRTSAARFSFLLSTPIVIGAGLFQLVDLTQADDLAEQAPLMLSGMAAAAIVGYVCIGWLLRRLQRGSLLPFAAYCALAGLIFLFLTITRIVA